MLPKTNRLTTESFDAVIADGRMLREGTLQMKYLKGQTPAFGVAVSKKVAPLSVRRHFVKRTIYRLLQKNLNLFPDVHGIIFISKETLAQNNDEIENSLKILAHKVASCL